MSETTTPTASHDGPKTERPHTPVDPTTVPIHAPGPIGGTTTDPAGALKAIMAAADRFPTCCFHVMSEGGFCGVGSSSAMHSASSGCHPFVSLATKTPECAPSQVPKPNSHGFAPNAGLARYSELGIALHEIEAAQAACDGPVSREGMDGPRPLAERVSALRQMLARTDSEPLPPRDSPNLILVVTTAFLLGVGVGAVIVAAFFVLP